MKTFKNTNGKTYEIVETKGDHSLLIEQGKNPSYQPYIVAWCLDLNEKSWLSGSYFANYKIAEKRFKEKTKNVQ